MAHTSADTDISQSFSTIKFFRSFERKLKAFNEFPLVGQNLAVQQDAYKRLINSEDEQDVEFFAQFEYSHKTTDSDIRFNMQFAADIFVLNIEGLQSTVFVYTECFKDEADAVKQIMTVLQLLASGQLAILLTERGDYRCASELLLFQPGSSIPVVLLTESDYPRSWKKKDETGYETVLLRNSFISGRVSLPDRFFMADQTLEGEVLPKGRIFDTPELTPLTKHLFSATLEDTIMRESGRKPGESDASLMLRSPEYWLMLIVIFTVVYGGVALDIIPEWVGLLPIVVIPFVILLSAFVLLPMLARKEHLKAYHPDHWWVRFDDWFAHHLVAPARIAFGRVAAIWPSKKNKNKD